MTVLRFLCNCIPALSIRTPGEVVIIQPATGPSAIWRCDLGKIHIYAIGGDAFHKFIDNGAILYEPGYNPHDPQPGQHLTLMEVAEYIEALHIDGRLERALANIEET